jgi:transposase
MLSGVLWVLGTGAQWRELPDRYPPYQTCHRRFQQWVPNSKLEKVLGLLAKHLHERGKLSLREFRERKKRGLAVGPPRGGKGTKIVAIAADNSLPLAVSVQSASPHESQLVEEALARSFLDELPARLVGNRAYDSDPLARKLDEEYGIELIAPHRGRRRTPTQDGRRLRRYGKRWRGAAICLVTLVSQARHSLRVPRRELSRYGPARLCHAPAETRQVMPSNL